MDIKKEGEQENMLAILDKVTQDNKKGKRRDTPHIKKVVSQKRVKTVANSNWAQHQQEQQQQQQQQAGGSKQQAGGSKQQAGGRKTKEREGLKKRLRYEDCLDPKEESYQGATPVLSLDCEMVKCGEETQLARVTIVNYNGHVLVDEYVRPKKYITNYLTWVSGITRNNIAHAPTWDQLQNKVETLLTGRTILGHSLQNDFRAMGYTPKGKTQIRDLAQVPFLQEGVKATKGLAKMADEYLGMTIQKGQHSSVEDARSVLAIYRKFEKKIEHYLKDKK